MAKGNLEVPRESLEQPDLTDTSKAQKRRAIDAESSPQLINNELDYLHERLNKIVVEAPPLANLVDTATLPEVIVRVNEILETLRQAALRKQS